MPTPNMNLTVPGVGVTAGPDYANDINASLNIIDAHDHSTGSGVPITPGGLNINADLAIGHNNLTQVRSTRYDLQITPLSLPADTACTYVSGVDLYFNDGSGNKIRMTQSGGVAGTPGSISNLVSPASAAYVALSGTFVFQSAANTAASMDVASVTLRDTTVSSLGLTLSPPVLASNYTITLPTLPATPAVVTIDSSGNMAANTSLYGAFNPVGTVIAYAGASVPSGYVLCDGTAVSRSVYANLFAAIGTAWGSGDGSTTFNLPDLRGQFLRGVSGASGNDPDASSRTASNAGGNTGNNVGSKQSSAFASHNHGVNDPGHSHTSTLATQAGSTPSFGPITPTDFVSGSPTTTIPTNTVGTGVSIQNAGGSTETRPTNVYVVYCIKT